MIGGGEGSFIGGIHYRAAMLDGDYELVCGAFSRNPNISAQTGKRYHLNPNRVYNSWETMLTTENSLPMHERMEVVTIATPNHLHFPQAMAALNNGFHVICDKPVTISLEQALELKETVEKTGLVFGLTHNYTGYPMVKEARKIVRSGQLGIIRKVVVEYPQGWLTTPIEHSGSKQAEWRTNPDINGPGGCLGDIGIHAENLAEYITGLSIEYLCADLTSFVPSRKLDDDASVLLRFKGGAKGVLYASQISAGEENALKIRVYGDKGGVEWQQMNPNILVLKLLDKPTQLLSAGTNQMYLNQQTRLNLRLPAGHPEGFIEAFANIYGNIAARIISYKSGDPLSEHRDFPTIDDGVRGMLFIEKVLESSVSKTKWIPFQ